MARHRIFAFHHLVTFAALLALATVSLLLGVSVRAPYWGLVIGLSVAVIKTLLVLWVFMHMAEQPFRARLAIGVAVLLVLLLVSLTTLEVATRDMIPPASYPGPRETFFER
jgi:caa(3)-type oxidase subunit IV